MAGEFRPLPGESEAERPAVVPTIKPLSKSVKRKGFGMGGQTALDRDLAAAQTRRILDGREISQRLRALEEDQ